MSEDLAELPLKSLQLPTKTVAKLKPLGATTIKALYAVPLARFIELGLVRRELEELAEAAPDFGCRWSSKAEVEAAFGATQPSEKKAKVAATPRKRKAPGDLPADFEEALTEGPEAVGLTGADINAFAPYGSLATGFQTPPPSARHLRVYRRLRQVRGPSLGGPERWYVVGVVDVTQLPRERRSELPTLLCHFGNLLADVFLRAGVESMSLNCGGATTFAIRASARSRAQGLIDAHNARFDAAPAFSGPLEDLVGLSAAALISAGLQAEARPFSAELARAAKGLATPTALEALRSLCALFPDDPAEARASLEPLLTPVHLARVPSGRDSVSALIDVARLCVRANAKSLAVAVLARALAVEPSDVRGPSARAVVLDEPVFDALHRDAAFKALFLGFPAFTSRLGVPRT